MRKREVITLAFVLAFVLALSVIGNTYSQTRRNRALCPTQKAEVKKMLKPIETKIDSLKRVNNIIVIELKQTQKMMPPAPVQTIQTKSSPAQDSASSPFPITFSVGMMGNRERGYKDCQEYSFFRTKPFIEVGAGITQGIWTLGGFIGAFASTDEYPLYGGGKITVEVNPVLSISGGGLYQREPSLERLMVLTELTLKPPRCRWGELFGRIVSGPGGPPLFFFGIRI